MAEKLKYDYIKSEFEKRGYTLLSKEYENCYSKLDFICSNDHKYSITWNDFRSGCGCGLCSNNKKLETVEIEKILKELNPNLKIIKVDRKINNNRNRIFITFKCSCGNEYTKSFDTIKKGKFLCSKCGHKNQGHADSSYYCKYTLEDVKKFIDSIGYMLLSNKYQKMNDPILVQCKNIKHKPYYTTFTNLYYNNYRCRKCAYEELSGNKSPKWKNEILDNNRKIRDEKRNNKELNKWRRFVLKRDHRICQITGLTDKLVVHHIESYKLNKSLRFDPNNGITLSESIHKLIHKYFGRYTTMSDLNDFIELWRN